MKKSILIAIVIVLILAVAATVFFVLKSSYDVTFDTNGGSMYSESTVDCKVGETYKMPIPTKEGYVFLGWYDNPEFKGNSIVEFGAGNVFESENLTFYAKFVKICNITYVVNGFTTDNPASIRSDECVTLNAPSVTGAIFDGWYLDKEFTKAVTKIENPDGDMILYAKLLQQHTISYNLSGGTNNPANPEFYASEKGAILYAPTRAGYDFVGWVDFNGYPINGIEVGAEGMVRVRAKWEPKTYNISWMLNGGSAPADYKTDSYVVGEGIATQDMMIPTSQNGIFMYWYMMDGDQEVIVTSIDENFIGDAILYAKWYANDTVSSKEIWKESYDSATNYKHFTNDNVYIKVPDELKAYADAGKLGINLYVRFECTAQTHGNASTKSSIFLRINGEKHEICSVSASGGGYWMDIAPSSGSVEKAENYKEYQIMFGNDNEIVLGYDYYVESDDVNTMIKKYGNFICYELSYSFFIAE